MSRENTAGLGVNNFYGPRSVPEGNGGTIKTEGGSNELSFEFTGANINDGDLDSITLPAGIRVLSSYVEVSEAFVLGGTTPTINVGTSGSAATNGVSINEAGGEAVGVYTDGDANVTINGTWATATGLATATVATVALGGTTPTVTSAGKARFVVVYVKV